jgi:hypothetical protein
MQGESLRRHWATEKADAQALPEGVVTRAGHE